jgi:hypothetical protein
VIATIAIALALSAAPAPEAELGSRSDPAHVQELHRAGACLANQRTVQVRVLLRMDYGTDEYRRVMRKLGRSAGKCPGWQELDARGYQVSGLLLGGAMAEGLLHRDDTLKRLGDATALNLALPAIKARSDTELMAFCVVRANPVEVATFLGTDPATKEEFLALKALSATLSGCVTANNKSQFSREALRALIALGAYRLAVHNQQAKPHA